MGRLFLSVITLTLIVSCSSPSQMRYGDKLSSEGSWVYLRENCKHRVYSPLCIKYGPP